MFTEKLLLPYRMMNVSYCAESSLDGYGVMAGRADIKGKIPL